MDLAARILYEDNHLIAVNKLPGEIVQGDKTGDQPLSELLKAYIKVRDNKPGEVFIGVPHRLDRPVSGVALFAKTSKALSRLNALFREGGATKHYLALTAHKPQPEEGRLRHFLLRNEKQNKSYPYAQAREGAKEALLNYRLVASGERYHLIDVELLTGRHHQIRCQLAAVGCPIKGDLKYGAPRSNPDGSISLHARSLSFEHPVRHTPLEILAPPPADRLWQELCAQAGLL